MDTCKFESEGQSCSEPMYVWPLCREHRRLYKEVYDFYKAAECQLRPLFGSDESDEYLFEERHKWLLLAISARTIHAELFFADSPCEGHEMYINELSWRMHQEEITISIRGKGFVVKGASYGDIRSVADASMRQACFDWSKSDKKRGLWHFILGFPRAVATGTTVPEEVVRRMQPRNFDDVEW
ncbi:hypothetical protein F5Y10DRAFT_270481 [Nemania abortiva]|nr:hypothetical protein F5Y10DRAFT_270481 [Nemania abortiva]